MLARTTMHLIFTVALAMVASLIQAAPIPSLDNFFERADAGMTSYMSSTENHDQVTNEKRGEADMLGANFRQFWPCRSGDSDCIRKLVEKRSIDVSLQGDRPVHYPFCVDPNKPCPPSKAQTIKRSNVDKDQKLRNCHQGKIGCSLGHLNKNQEKVAEVRIRPWGGLPENLGLGPPKIPCHKGACPRSIEEDEDKAHIVKTDMTIDGLIESRNTAKICLTNECKKSGNTLLTTTRPDQSSKQIQPWSQPHPKNGKSDTRSIIQDDSQDETFIGRDLEAYGVSTQ